MKRVFFTIGLFLCAGLSSAFAVAPPSTKIIIQVDLNAHALRVEKVTGRQRKRLDMRTLPTVKDSLRAGWYRPAKLRQRYRSANGNIFLENVIFFDRTRSIRTTRFFRQMAQEGNAVGGSIILEPDFGNILFDTVRRYGMSNTWIYIRK